MNERSDNISENPGVLPYGSNVGAPAISIENIEDWKNVRVKRVNKQFEDKFLQIKKEYEKLIGEYKWNELVYKSKFNFEPVIGNIYNLYYSSSGDIFLSIIGPNEWNKEFIGSFKYNHDNKWEKIDG